MTTSLPQFLPSCVLFYLPYHNNWCAYLHVCLCVCFVSRILPLWHFFYLYVYLFKVIWPFYLNGLTCLAHQVFNLPVFFTFWVFVLIFIFFFLCLNLYLNFYLLPCLNLSLVTLFLTLLFPFSFLWSFPSLFTHFLILFLTLILIHYLYSLHFSLLHLPSCFTVSHFHHIYLNYPLPILPQVCLCLVSLPFLTFMISFTPIITFMISAFSCPGSFASLNILP